VGANARFQTIRFLALVSRSYLIFLIFYYIIYIENKEREKKNI